jgi:hypothetical protein
MEPTFERCDCEFLHAIYEVGFFVRADEVFLLGGFSS